MRTASAPRLDDPNGTVVGVFNLPDAGSTWTAPGEYSAALTPTPGIHDFYIVGVSELSTIGIAYIDWIRLDYP